MTDSLPSLFGIENPEGSSRSLCSSTNSIPISPIRNRSIDNCPCVQFHQRSQRPHSPRRLTYILAYRRCGGEKTVSNANFKRSNASCESKGV